MLSLLRKSDRAPDALFSAWHPDFRKAERLPDTKVIRTKFFVNFAAAAVTAALALYFVYQEYSISNVAAQVSDWQVKIDANKRASDQAVAVSRKFADDGKKLAELEAFMKPRLVLSEFLVHLGSVQPDGITILSVSVEETGVSLRGLSTGSPEEASGRISPYVELLSKDKYLNNYFAAVTQGRLERDQSGQLAFDMFLRFKGAEKK